MSRNIIVLSATVAVTAVLCWRRWRSSTRKLVQKYRDLLIPSREVLDQIRAQFVHQLKEGLKREVPANGKEMLMLPSFITKLPDGDEVGDVYALDLGGTNFRVKHVKLSKTKSEIESEDSTEVSIPKEVYTGTGDGLFDFIAKATIDFISKHSENPSGEPPILGFCFSFALQQTSINQGVLLDWTKGFTCSGVIGNDPVELLSLALERAGKPCRVLALLNDTVGVLTAQRYIDPQTAIGVIIGTGTNASYVEKAERVVKWRPSEQLEPNTDTVINIEWGAFDCDDLPRCPEDRELDRLSLHTGKYLFEKLLSGLYLGEAARLILLSLAREASVMLFVNDDGAPIVPKALTVEGSFPASLLSVIVEDSSISKFAVAREVRQALGLHTLSYEARYVIYEICSLVALRSSTLVAMALSGLLEHTGWKSDPRPISVAFDGGVYVHFPQYRKMLGRALTEQLGNSNAKMVKAVLSHDGSGLGAAVLAAAAASSQK